MSKTEPLRLPEGYTIEVESGLLTLKRPDRSPVAAFEFSAMGPDPFRIWEMDWDDTECASEP